MGAQRKYQEWSIVVDFPHDFEEAAKNTDLAMANRLFFREGIDRIAKGSDDPEGKYFYLDYFGILHDRDFKPNGDLKTPHMHVVLQFVKAVTADEVILFGCEAFRVPPTCVSVERAKFMAGAVRYLIHADDDRKTSYEASEILTNAPKSLDDYLSSVVSLRAVVAFLQEGGDPLELMVRNGRAWWNANRNVVNDALRFMRWGCGAPKGRRAEPPSDGL